MNRWWKTVLPPAFVLACATASARAAEPWPPRTPPQVDTNDKDQSAAPPAVVSPLPRRPPAIVTPLPPPEASVVAEPQTEPEDERSPATAAPVATGSTTIVRVAPEPERGAGTQYGSVDGQAYLRTSGDELVLLPTGRLEVVGESLMAPTQYLSGQTLSLSLARVDVAGWVASKVFFNASADFSTGPSLRHVDNFLAFEPWGERAILQLGQFDVPFSLENRTPDRYLDFIMRGAAVRAFGIPENKDQGVMLHGTNPDRNFYWSAGVFNGEGPGVTGASGKADLVARAWAAPFSFRDPDALRDITLGGSLWTGDRSAGPMFESQTTAAGYVALDPTTWWMNGSTSPLAVREQGRFTAVGLELNAPLRHRGGFRFEWIGKRQPLSSFDVSDPSHPTIVGGLNLSGWAAYAEIWGWVIGDDRILGAPAAPGLELPPHLRDFVPSRPRQGLMLAARVDYVDETVTTGADVTHAGLGVASAGVTKWTTFTLGASYWYTRRARLDLNYVLSHTDGTTPFVLGLDGQIENEILFRTAFSI
jgi:phosphate-selective porin O/P